MTQNFDFCNGVSTTSASTRIGISSLILFYPRLPIANGYMLNLICVEKATHGENPWFAERFSIAVNTRQA